MIPLTDIKEIPSTTMKYKTAILINMVNNGDKLVTESRSVSQIYPLL